MALGEEPLHEPVMEPTVDEPLTPGREARRVAVAAALAGAASTWLVSPAVREFDRRVVQLVDRTRHPGIDIVAVVTTDLGSLGATAGLVGMFVAAKRPRDAADLAVVGLAAWTIGQASKRLTKRLRPYEADRTTRLIAPPLGSSFPSGHAAVSAAVWQLLRHRTRGRRLNWLSNAITLWVPVTRVVVGVHYPSDVLAGAGLGLVLVEAVRLVSEAATERVLANAGEPGHLRTRAAGSGRRATPSTGRPGRRSR